LSDSNAARRAVPTFALPCQVAGHLLADASLQRKERESPPRKVVFDGDFEAKLLSVACSAAPEGRTRWTVRLLAEKLVELDIVPSVSAMTVCNTLKKRASTSPAQILEDPAGQRCGVRSDHGGEDKITKAVSDVLVFTMY
jgi:hypothetical protein